MASPMHSLDPERLFNFEGLQHVLVELLDASHKQQAEVAGLRADVEKRLAALARRVDGIDAALDAHASEREVRRVEHEAGAARDAIVRTIEALGSKFNAAVETIDARDARRLLLLNEVHNEVKACAPAAHLQRVEQALVDRISLEQLQGTRQALEQQLRASSDAWQERAATLAKQADAHDAALAAHGQHIARLATAEALEAAQRELGAELSALGSELGVRLADARHAASASERRLDRRADELRAELEQQLSLLRRLEAELKAKVGREEAATQLDALATTLAAERRAADADTRAARDDVSLRMAQLAAIAEAAAEQAAATDGAARTLAPLAQFAALEERALGFASREEMRVEIDGLRVEALTRAKRIAERVELISAELIRVGGAADAAAATPSRQLEALWEAIEEQRAERVRLAAVAAAAATTASAAAAVPPAPAAHIATPSPRAPTAATANGTAESAGAAARYDSRMHPISAAQPYGAVRHGLAPRDGAVPSRLDDELARASGSPSVTSSVASPPRSHVDAHNQGAVVPLGGALSAVGLRTDLERRRRQLEERRQSIAAVRQRSAAAPALGAASAGLA